MPPESVIEPVLAMGPENVPPLVIVNAVGLRFNVPAPLSVVTLTAVFLSVAVPLSLRGGVEEIVEPEVMLTESDEAEEDETGPDFSVAAGASVSVAGIVFGDNWTNAAGGSWGVGANWSKV